MDNELVVCKSLFRSFSNTVALAGVDLTLKRGKIVGLLGPNGSGKTTFIKILNGLLQPDSGAVLIDGEKPGLHSKTIVSYLPDRPCFDEWMRIGDMIAMYKDFYADFDAAKAAEMCARLGLDTQTRIKTLSKGNKEKMQLMLVMSRKAQLYLLDEPIAGVDPAAREFILNTILSNYDENATVMLSTHLISDVEQIIDEAVFLKQGKVILHDNADDLRSREGKSIDELFRDTFREYMWGGNH